MFRSSASAPWRRCATPGIAAADPEAGKVIILDRPACPAQAKTWEFIFWVLPSSLDVPGQQPAQPAAFYSLHAKL